MQTEKEYIKERIIQSASRLFRARGYQKVSMREIAQEAQVSLGNIYNYYKSKDELFRISVAPVVKAFERMLDEHHGRRGKDIMMMQSEEYLRYVIGEYITIVKDYRDELTLLFFHAQGSSLESFKEDFTERSTVVFREYLNDMKRKHPELNINVSDFFVHLHNVWMFTLLEELIMHHITKDRIDKIITEYITCEVAGWRELMKI